MPSPVPQPITTATSSSHRGALGHYILGKTIGEGPLVAGSEGFLWTFFFAFRLQSTLGFCDWEHWGCTKTGFGGCCIDGHDYAEMIDHASPPSSRPTAPLLRCALCNLMPKSCVPHSQSQEHLAKSSLDVTSSPVKEWLSRFSRTLGEDETNYGVQARSGRLHRQLRSFLCVCQNRLNIHQVLNTTGKCFFWFFCGFAEERSHPRGGGHWTRGTWSAAFKAH